MFKTKGLSKYFRFKVETQDFIDNLKNILETLKDKKVLICGEVEGFIELDKLFNLSKKLNIVAFAKTGKQTEKGLKNLKIIEPENIRNENFDSILISDENSEKIYNLLFYILGLEKEDIKILFKEDIAEGKENLIYLLKHNFDKTLPKLIKKLKNKKVIFYGAGIFFEVIDKYFDLSKFNVIGLSDKKFRDVTTERYFGQYKMIHPNEIIKNNPDCVIVTVKRYVPTWEGLYYNYLEKTKIKLMPIVTKNLINRLIEFGE